MSRTLPMECEHGVIVDWGDFGPCQDCDEHEDEDCPNFADCEECEAERARWVRVPREEIEGLRAEVERLTLQRDELLSLVGQLTREMPSSAGEVRAGTCVPALPTPAHPQQGALPGTKREGKP